MLPLAPKPVGLQFLFLTSGFVCGFHFDSLYRLEDVSHRSSLLLRDVCRRRVTFQLGFVVGQCPRILVGVLV